MKSYLLAKCAIGIVVVAAVQFVPYSASAGVFLGLGDLPGGANRSFAFGVSNDGVAGGYSSSANGDWEAYIWTPSGMASIGDLPGGGFMSVVWRVSGDGHAAVGQGASENGPEAFRWMPTTGMAGLGELPGGLNSSIAFGVSRDGSVVVGVSEGANGPEAFRWTEATGMVGLGDLSGGGFGSLASTVSADGSILTGFATGALGIEAYRWTSATGMTGLGDLVGGAFRSEGAAISADGASITGFSSSAIGDEAFLWTQATGMMGLGILPGQTRSFGRGITGDGSVVVGVSAGPNTDGSERAFIWDATFGMRNLQSVLVNDYGLNLTGWTLTYAAAISEDGRIIVGYGTNSQGETEAWMADLRAVPEPASLIAWASLAAGLALKAGARRWRIARAESVIATAASEER